MDSSYSDSRSVYGQSNYGGWNQTQMVVDSVGNVMNSEQVDLHSQSESQVQPPQQSLKRPRPVDDNMFNSGSSGFVPTSNNNSWVVPSLNPPPMNKGTANIFYKTRMCAKFKAGTCRNGEICNFAHGLEDMRQPPPNWQEIVGPPVQDRERELRERERELRERERERERPPLVASGGNNWEDDQKIILRMKLCRKFCLGEECSYGDRCNFIHEDLSKFREESGKLRESSVISMGAIAFDPLAVENCNAPNQIEVSRQGGIIPVPAPMNNGVGVKTVYWKTRLCMKFEAGQCTFGEKCHYAHGQAELHNSTVGRIEGEAVNSVATAGKPMMIPANEAFAMQPNGQVTFDSSGLNDEGRRKKCLLKWSDSKKINRIYGDWIDDLPVGQSSTKPVES